MPRIRLHDDVRRYLINQYIDQSPNVGELLEATHRAFLFEHRLQAWRLPLDYLHQQQQCLPPPICTLDQGAPFPTNATGPLITLRH